MCETAAEGCPFRGGDMKLNTLLISALVAVSATAAGASELGDKFEKTAAAFAAAGTARQLTGASLAVFPFQAEEKLAKKKVDFAVGELLASHLLKQGVYKLTERVQLEEVLKEQKLGLSGAVDSKTASGIGKLLGARLLVLGNVIRMGDSYQITAKLIDSETSEMIASEITEVPVQTFDQEAGRYLALVPDQQAVGIFLNLGYGFTSTTKLGPQTYETLTLDPANPELPQIMGGIGIRYWAKPRWMAQFDFNRVASSAGGGGENLYTTANPATIAEKFRAGYTGFMVRVSLDRTTRPSAPFVWHNGAGLAFYNVDSVEMDKELQSTYGIYNVRLDTEGTSYFTPFLRTGVEWRPQARFGWSLFANMNVLSKDYIQEVTIDKGGAGQNFTIWKTSFPRFYLDSSIALYF